MKTPDEINTESKECNDALDDLARKVSIMEEIARYNLLILMSGIEEAETKGYESAIKVMVKELHKLAQWSTAAFDNKENNLKTLLSQNHFVKRHTN
ncbi:MAG: hypothetical protein HQL06_00145 [Nitrospirae bacterium]|nr:hypothetical protein [Nitrospirota bacterium]